MKHINWIFITSLLLIQFSCVQKSYKQNVVFTVDVSHLKVVKSVGLRGNDLPLSWLENTEMIEIARDSLYSKTLTFDTGYKFTDVKFVVNDTFELENLPNRKIIFDTDRNTNYHAIFNKPYYIHSENK